MIIIEDKKKCCGCMACVQRCPHQCITIEADAEGFSYPLVDESICINCGLCENVCPVINQSETAQPVIIYAAKNKDKQVVSESSSGGVFPAMAEAVIEKGGVVFGARFDDNWQCKLDYAESLEGIKVFRGSKYVQARTDTAYKDALRFLKVGRMVLFSGTPCQIAGLKRFIKREYDNLITVCVICHGVPSPGIWEDYKRQIPVKLVAGKNTVFSFLKSLPVITGINFRDKTEGWKKYGFSAKGVADRREAKNSVFPPVIYSFSEYHQKHVYMRGFLNNLYLRPSCYSCPARKGKSGADIQLGDYWGVQRRSPAFYDPMGVSLVLIYTDKGNKLFNEINFDVAQASYADVIDCNVNVEIDEKEPSVRSEFFYHYSKHGLSAISKYCNRIENHDFLWYCKKVYVKLIKTVKK